MCKKKLKIEARLEMARDILDERDVIKDGVAPILRLLRIYFI